jgi:hypothetical protein
MMRRALLCLTIFTAACGGSSSGDDGGGGGSVDAAPPDAPLGSFTVTFGPVTVQSGQENTQCVVKRLGNPEALRVNQIHNVLGESSHHFIVYRTADTVEQTTPFDCQPFTDTLDPSKGSPLMITQKADEVLQLPAGVAFTLDPDQMIRLEMHYINTGDGPVDVTGSATFIPIADADFMYEADFLFIGDPDINIPASSTFSLGPIYFQVPAMFAGAKFFGITGHTHQWGTNVTVATSPSETGADTPVYDVQDWNWDEPATVYADPPFEIPSGGGFRFTCEWNNLSSQAVGFGESANDEMCFFWAYYYPSVGAYVCAHTDQVPGGYDLCCPGNPVCGMLF